MIHILENAGIKDVPTQVVYPAKDFVRHVIKSFNVKKKQKTEMTCTQCQKPFDSYDGVLICDDCTSPRLISNKIDDTSPGLISNINN